MTIQYLLGTRPHKTDQDCSRPFNTIWKPGFRKCRNSSSPGPNGIPYLVWKRCSSLAQMLYTIVCRVWSSGKITSSWQQAIITLIPKSGVLNDPSQFWPIALSNCDGKVFFTLLSKRLLEYLISNNYVSTQVQKGFQPNIAGCVEHSTLTLSALKDAKLAGKNICVSWIDQRNAFGSIRHSLLQCVLKKIPTVWKQSRASMLQLLKYSRDTRVRSLFKGKLEAEEKCLPGNNKYAPCIEC